MSVLDVLRRYDDEAWAALATKGLLRRARKDLTQQTPEIIAAGNESVEVRIGEQTVVFGPDGPVSATCTCPSGTVCQHVIGAGLWWVENAESPSDLGAAGLATPEGSAGPDGSAASAQPAGPARAARPAAEDQELLAELLALGRAELTAFATPAGYRWAREFLENAEVEVANLVVSFISPRVTFRYLGGGLTGLLADTRLPALEKYQVAAVLAVQRDQGIELEPVQRREQPAVRELVVHGREAVRAAVVQLVGDTVRLGVAHLSEATLQRYESLAVSARGAQYYRLAGALRAMAGQIELALARSARADEQLLLEQAATTYALVSALEAGDAPHLMGSARSRYEAVRKLELIGLGSVPWRTASGYAGLTTLFWSVTDRRFVSWSDSRPQTVEFNPRARYTAVAPWAGLDSPAQATGARIKLSDARLASTGRLSGVETTRAFVVPLTGQELSSELPAVQDWSELANRPPVSLLDPADPLRDWAVLRPADFAPPHFDPAAQRLEWIVSDGRGERLPLRILYTPTNEHAVDRLERMPAAEPGALVIAKVSLTGEGLIGEPLSLVVPTAPAGASVSSLHFGAADGIDPGTVVPPPRESRSVRPRPPTTAVAAAAAPPRELVELRRWLVVHAERGTGGVSSGAFSTALAQHHQRLRAAGFSVFPSQVAPDPTAALLRSLYLTLQISQLLGGSDD